MRFERGIVQMCFWALDDMEKAQVNKSLYAVPIGIKYHYPRKTCGILLTLLSRG